MALHDKDTKVIKGSGNVFADLGHPDAEIKLAKAELARQIGKAIAGRKLTATAAAEILGTDQPKVSKILNGRLGDFSLERLATFLTKLNRDVEIRVTTRARGNAGCASRRRSAFARHSRRLNERTSREPLRHPRSFSILMRPQRLEHPQTRLARSSQLAYPPAPCGRFDSSASPWSRAASRGASVARSDATRVPQRRPVRTSS